MTGFFMGRDEDTEMHRVRPCGNNKNLKSHLQVKEKWLNSTLPTPQSQTSSIQNCEANFCCLNHLVCVIYYDSPTKLIELSIKSNFTKYNINYLNSPIHINIMYLILNRVYITLAVFMSKIHQLCP